MNFGRNIVLTKSLSLFVFLRWLGIGCHIPATTALPVSSILVCTCDRKGGFGNRIEISPPHCFQRRAKQDRRVWQFIFLLTLWYFSSLWTPQLAVAVEIELVDGVTEYRNLTDYHGFFTLSLEYKLYDNMCPRA